MAAGEGERGTGGVALIVAHGQPSDPMPAEAETAALGARVAALLPGWQVLTATLAAEGALATAIAAARSGPLSVYPLFMADGWFTQTHLPERLRAAGAGEMMQLRPFGMDPDVQALTVTLAREGLEAAGWQAAETDLLLAAHGSFRSAAPARVARDMASRIAAEVPFRQVATGFIDQEPQITGVAGTLGRQSLCLPFFAARGGHVIDDLPAALAEAAFVGRLLPPVGLDSRVPGLIARGLERPL